MEYKCVGLQQTARSPHVTSSRATSELCLTSECQRKSPKSRGKVCQTYHSSTETTRKLKVWRAKVALYTSGSVTWWHMQLSNSSVLSGPRVGHLMAIALDLQNSEEVSVLDYSF